MLGLDVGCGERKKDNFVGLDIRKLPQVAIVADTRKLPLRNEAFDYMYSSHLIEHFSHREVGRILAEWVRVLKRGGILEILCPDLRARALLFFLKLSWENVKNIYRGQEHKGNYHKCGFS